MSTDPSAPEERFPLEAGRAVVLAASGLRAPRRLLGGERFVAYRDVTHLMVGRRTLRIATRSGVVVLARSRFAEPGGALACARALYARIGALPDGAERRAAFDALDRKLLGPPPTLGRGIALACVALFALQKISPAFASAGIYHRDYVRAGELWRLVTAQLLHADVAHLALNALSVFAVGVLLERAIGRAALVFVAGVSALGAMLACWLAGYSDVVGISGVVCGMVGALALLELAAPEQLPAAIRIPRGLLFGAIAIDGTSAWWLPLLFPRWAPQIATLVHVGGFAAGAFAGLLLRQRRPSLVGLGATATALVTVASFVWLGASLAWPGDAAARRARALLERAESLADLNNLAWEIATSEHPSADELAAAERMAERAVALTRRSDPNILDTLAEVYFVEGRISEALDAIDEAIALAPGEPYFEEQRRRFAGERPPEDRPAPPEPQREPEQAPDGAPELPELPPGDEVTV